MSRMIDDLLDASRVVNVASSLLSPEQKPAYLAEVCTQQFRIEQDKYTLALINATDGAEYDQAKATQKDVLFCGLPTEEVELTQNSPPWASSPPG